MRKLVIVIMTLFGLFGLGCGASSNKGYEIISREIAHDIMSKPGNYVVVDVREADEYAAGHIPDAISVPLSNLEKVALEKIPEKKILLLVYCRSGRRSKIAAGKLAKLGYVNIKEFGGIIDWKYEITK